MSGDTVARLSWALDAPVDSMAPEWELPEDPHEPGYGPKIRSRRRALGHSLQTIARQVGVSTATLSRFERGLSLPRGWVFEWTSASGRSRHAIVVEPLAAALRFPSRGRDECRRQIHPVVKHGDDTSSSRSHLR